MNEIAAAIGPILAAMPPWLAGLVVISLSVAAVVYAYQRAGKEVEREQAKSNGGIAAKLDALSAGQDGIHTRLDQIHTGIEVLKDRRR